MAESRLHMETKDHKQIVEMPDTVTGFNFLAGLRCGRPDLFFRSRIKSIIQMQPSKVQIGVLVDKWGHL